MSNLFGEESPTLPMELDTAQPNPCVRVYGYGPEDEKCKTCAHLHVHQCANRYYKCLLRNNTSGPGTDHRVGWRACGKWEGKS